MAARTSRSSGPTLAVALTVAVIWALPDHRLLRRYTYVSLAVGFILLLLPLMPGIGREVNGSRIWIAVGPFSFQPGEFAKIALAIFFAGYLVQTRDVLSLAGKRILGFTFPRGRDLGPILVAWVLALLILVFEKDLGSALLFFGVFVAMLYVATERVSWIAIGLLLFGVAVAFALSAFAHFQKRVDLWLEPFSPDNLERSNQLANGLWGMAAGGLTGTGLGAGRPWLTSFAESDFIFSSLAEELGLFGSVAILMLYLVFVQRGIRTALGVRDGFGKLLAIGLTFSVAFQLFIVIGGVTRVIPLTGLTTPFLSLGGSSLLANWIIMSLLLRISDQARTARARAARRCRCRPGCRRGHPGGEAVNTPIRRLSVLIAALFGALLVASTIIQFAQAQSLNLMAANKRTLLDNYSRERGSILVEGQAIAKSVPVDDQFAWLRTYPEGRLYSQITGFYAYSIGNPFGLENAADDLLSGKADRLFVRRVTDLLTGRDTVGATIELTLNAKAQQAASEGLGKNRGAVVALDPRTGAILAMVSHPQYDPNPLSSHDLAKSEAAWKKLSNDKAKPFINRASPVTSTRRAPSSRSSPPRLPSSRASSRTRTPRCPDPGARPAADRDEPAQRGRAGLRSKRQDDAHPRPRDLVQHRVRLLGLELGGEQLRAQAAKFGFGDSLQIPMRVSPSTMPAEINAPQAAQSAIGQYEVRTTPLQMAMIAGGIANQGRVMTPYLIQSVRTADLDVIESAPDPEELSQAVSPRTADILKKMMVSVVDNGSGRRAQIDGVAVGGKTGTAQHDLDKNPHAWFISFAPADDPQVAVAVVVEESGVTGNEVGGARVAAPIAKDVMEAVINR